MKYIKLILLYCCFVFFVNISAQYEQYKANLIVFSFDRPMQLFALLESLERYVTGLDEVIVIYRSSNDQFELAYQEVQEYFSTIQYWRQGQDPRSDFKPLTQDAVFSTKCDYILFAVDDIIVKDFIDISGDIKKLEKYNAYAFFYRLGLHLNWCYPRCHATSPPLYECLEGDLCCWQFKNGQYDWGYPHTVDMTLYRKRDIQDFFLSCNYYAPNSLEGSWAGCTSNIMHRLGLFYKLSKIVNLPLNRVQNECKNIHMNSYSAYDLLEMFNQGLKIDIAPLYRMENNGAHTEYVPMFIERE